MYVIILLTDTSSQFPLCAVQVILSCVAVLVFHLLLLHLLLLLLTVRQQEADQHHPHLPLVDPAVHALLWRYMIVFFCLSINPVAAWRCSGAFVKVEVGARELSSVGGSLLSKSGQVVAPAPQDHPYLDKRVSFLIRLDFLNR